MVVVGGRRGRILVVQAVVVALAALGLGAVAGAGAGAGAAAAQVRAVRGALARLEQRLLEVRVGLHVAREWRAVRRPQLLVAARVGRRQVARVLRGVAEGGHRGGTLRLRALLLRLVARRVLCAHTHTHETSAYGARRGDPPGRHWPRRVRSPVASFYFVIHRVDSDRFVSSIEPGSHCTGPRRVGLPARYINDRSYSMRSGIVLNIFLRSAVRLGTLLTNSRYELTHFTV